MHFEWGQRNEAKWSKVADDETETHCERRVSEQEILFASKIIAAGNTSDGATANAAEQ